MKFFKPYNFRYFSSNYKNSFGQKLKKPNILYLYENLDLVGPNAFIPGLKITDVQPHHIELAFSRARKYFDPAITGNNNTLESFHQAKMSY